jgi:hypothetical protein
MSLAQYNGGIRPWLPWLLLSVLAGSLLFFIDFFVFHLEFHKKLLGPRSDLGRILFLYYSIIFAAFWVTYFASERFKFQTLRQLLKLNSKQWVAGTLGALDEREHADLVRGYEEKGKITITSQSILVAVSTLMIVNIYGRRNTLMLAEARPSLHAATPMPLVEPDLWEKTLLNGGLIFAVAAFILLIFAVDCMDTMFNQFAEKRLDLINYLYVISARKKYYGMLCVVTALVLFVGSVLPSVAAFGIGLFLFIGYKFWCHRGDLDTKMTWCSLGFLTRLALCVIPLIFILIKGDGF